MVTKHLPSQPELIWVRKEEMSDDLMNKMEAALKSVLDPLPELYVVNKEVLETRMDEGGNETEHQYEKIVGLFPTEIEAGEAIKTSLRRHADNAKVSQEKRCSLSDVSDTRVF